MLGLTSESNFFVIHYIILYALFFLYFPLDLDGFLNVTLY